MSALAKLCINDGHNVIGSDRNHDRKLFSDHFKKLEQFGIQLVPQDGSAINSKIDALIVSSAVEPSIPDVKKAQELNISIIKRARLLADMANAHKGIAIAGTSGKSTVTGMVGWCLSQLNYKPKIMNGAEMCNFGSNAMTGSGEYFVYEADESDGSIAFFEPEIALVTNISEDHKSLDELINLFSDFVTKARLGSVINLDCEISRRLLPIANNTITFSLLSPEADIYAGNYNLNLQVPGKHNVSNALAALAVCKLLNISEEKVLKTLQHFKGIKSRLEVIGTKNNITVIDDFAHNPDKINASLQTLKEEQERLIVFYQPHGFGPTKMHKEGLIQEFTTHLNDRDILIISEIFYAGGTADKSISSSEIVEAIQEKGINAYFVQDKKDAQNTILDQVKEGDRIVIMGARDDGLRQMAQSIFKAL